MTTFTWFLTLASLAGTMMNIRMDRRCFYVWSVTNAGWSAVNFLIGQYAQSFLFLVYFVLSLQGLRQWQRRQANS